MGCIGCTSEESDNKNPSSGSGGSNDGDDNDNSSDDDDDATDCNENNPDWTVGLLHCTSDSTDGYTLFAPMFSTTTYLIGIHGRLVHSWKSDHFPGLSAYLLEDGSLLRTVNIGDDSIFISEGLAGGFELRDWDGELLWKYDYNSSLYSSHHDIEMLPNGNVLMIAWQRKSFEEAIDAGLKVNRDLWPDSIIEVEQDGVDSGNIVWEWYLWDHLVQDYDSGKDNYGVVEDHPELVDINYPEGGLIDWTHTNSVDYNTKLDQIVISVRNFSEIWVIDHSTTTAEAAGHTGGNFGKGGDLLYRWGNPEAYQAGNTTDRKLFEQHDVQWILDGYSGAGNFLVYNNGTNRSDGDYSTVDEWSPPADSQGVYEYVSGQAYGPDSFEWTYVADNPTDFYSPNISGAQRQTSGNTLICEGALGHIFEVTSEGEIVWSYVNPVFEGGILNQGDSPWGNGEQPIDISVFRSYRYPPDYPAFEGRDLTPGGYIEGPSD